MNNDKILKDFLAKDKAAELGGGTRKSKNNIRPAE